MKRCGLALLFLLLLGGCGGDQVRLANGDAAPDFMLPALDERVVHLSELRGQVVVVRFWADWCRFCDGEMRALEPVYSRLHGRGLELLAVNVGQERDTAARFVDRLKISYPALLDQASEVAQRYGVIALPTTFVVDKKGVIRGKILGESEPGTLEAMVSGLLQES
jgi:peroxiredoxin